MALKEFVYGLIKVLAVWLVAYLFLPALIGTCLYFFYTDPPIYITEDFIQPVLHLSFYSSVIVVLWLGADKISTQISGRYSSENETQNQKLNLPENKVLAIGFILMGIYILALKIPVLFGLTIDIIQDKLVLDRAFTIRSLIETITTIILALCLIIGRRRIIKIIMQLRSAGIEKQSEQ